MTNEELEFLVQQNKKRDQRNYLIIAVALAIVVSFAFISILSDNRESLSETTETLTPEQIRKEQLEKLFSAWDGSNVQLTRLIKDSMNDPDSYDHVETVYWDMTDYLVVRTTFRGKNKFGGVVKNWVKAKVDLNGNVIEVLEQGE